MDAIAYSDINSLKVGIVFFIILIMFAMFSNDKTNMMRVYKVGALLVSINFLLSILTPEFSILNWLSIDAINNIQVDNNVTKQTSVDLWAIRGQMGDILAGHFTALAFIGLLASLHYQRKSIYQMQESILQNNEVINLQNASIEQQNKALIQQTEAVHIQIKEFEQQTEEYRNQTKELSYQREELEVSKIYRRFEFYYGQLDELKKNVSYYADNQRKTNFTNLLSDSKYLTCFIFESDFDKIFAYHAFILDEIKLVKYPEIKSELWEFYQLYMQSIDIKELRRLKFKGKILSRLKSISLNFDYHYQQIISIFEDITYISSKDKNAFLDTIRIKESMHIFDVLELLARYFDNTDYVQKILDD